MVYFDNISDKELKDMPHSKIIRLIEADIYETALIFERLESLLMIRGNGHHIAQKLADEAAQIAADRLK